MFKAKHNRGRMLSRKAVWIFGMVERSSNKVLMFQVEKRDAATLLPLIKDHVLNDTMSLLYQSEYVEDLQLLQGVLHSRGQYSYTATSRDILNPSITRRKPSILVVSN
ncbi:hypothetical protein GCK72_025024 [Caenorhabditis remanei]|uniref:Uncharacterized protein n=1 Tax=Caenorhabditis remanei TaxID=31234 RepID=A0A6A5G0T2_CAERE|nr:hypothetical protein GCK72_025024 [Caenorhabditis remanei]KAF1748557.1 hypothetical protein GCK72_025024 [Caenorhabditis remanei]